MCVHLCVCVCMCVCVCVCVFELLERTASWSKQLAGVRTPPPLCGIHHERCWTIKWASPSVVHTLEIASSENNGVLLEPC